MDLLGVLQKRGSKIETNLGFLFYQRVHCDDVAPESTVADDTLPLAGDGPESVSWAALKLSNALGEAQRRVLLCGGVLRVFLRTLDGLYVT